jgi:hypothetical protein
MPNGAREGGNHRPGNGGRYGLHCGEITIRGDGETGFYNIHAQAIELTRQTRLFAYIHATARRLLAVA